MRVDDVAGNIFQALLLGVKTGAVKLAAGEEAFLWAFSHPTLLRNCRTARRTGRTPRTT